MRPVTAIKRVLVPNFADVQVMPHFRTLPVETQQNVTTRLLLTPNEIRSAILGFGFDTKKRTRAKS